MNRTIYAFAVYALMLTPLSCCAQTETAPTATQAPTTTTIQEIISSLPHRNISSIRELVSEYESTGNVLPTARMVTTPNLKGKPTWRYIGWENWDGHTRNWKYHRHKYPYYYYRYYPKYSHEYAYIPYYDYWITPSYEYTGKSVLLDELRLRDKYREVEYKVIGMVAHLNTNDDDRRLELKRAIRASLVELDRIKERIYFLRAP